jgi:hypothetical protein
MLFAPSSFRRSATADRQLNFPCTAHSFSFPGFGGEGVGPSRLFPRPGSPPTPAAPSLRQTCGGSCAAELELRSLRLRHNPPIPPPVAFSKYRILLQ